MSRKLNCKSQMSASNCCKWRKHIASNNLTKRQMECLREIENSFLYYRSNIAMLVPVFIFSFQCCFNKANFQVTDEILKEGKADFFNEEVALRLLFVGKQLQIYGTICRILLILISIKKPGVCKLYQIFDLLMIICDFCMVQTTLET